VLSIRREIVIVVEEFFDAVKVQNDRTHAEQNAAGR
jgi:hypothetical protein